MTSFIDEVTYDEMGDAAYIRLVQTDDDERLTTAQVQEKSIHLDFDSEDQLVGVEVLDASEHLPEKLLKRARSL